MGRKFDQVENILANKPRIINERFRILGHNMNNYSKDLKTNSYTNTSK